MGYRSRIRNSASQYSGFLPIRRLPWRRLKVSPVLAGLSLLLVTGCDRAALEQAFAPDPQLIGENGADSNGSTTSNNSKSTAPGGAASNNSTTGSTNGSKTQTGPGGGSNPRIAGNTISGSNSSANNQAKPSNQKTNGDDSPQPKNGENSAQSNDSSNSNNGSIPAELESSVADVLALGVLTPSDQAAVDGGFEANEPVTRGDFARWLLAANNAVYGDRPAAQIRFASGNSEPIFKDVAKNNPNFPAIQGLAEAGIIPSSLSGAQEQINFKPDAPLTREDMLLWKVPLDVRQSLPASNLEAVKEAWGFQDASKASAPALRAILADYSNGDQAVIRRVFGYTTLLQPQKPVTQAEAAAALWYFGNSGQGVSAGDVPVGELGEVEGNENIGG